ncbi:MAG: hypothetical protein EZS28_011428 [Streblomastix strix]|uniref:Uncharacterized protein n=1 Tax=Streblomastix strix TaxID=222440 RepID=A0A5J4WF66_9EUKA|nr:MAG: hypothetical protein EZS28_011428 [Streblomastix strix]
MSILAGIIESVVCSVSIQWLNKKRWIIDKENKKINENYKTYSTPTPASTLHNIGLTKQPQAASDVIIRCRMLRPPIALRVVLASEVLEQQRERMMKNKLKATLLRRTLTALE